MAQKQPARKKERPSRASGTIQRRGVQAQQIFQPALDQLETCPERLRPETAAYSLRDIFSVLGYAAAHKITIEQTSARLENAPSSTTGRGAAGSLEVAALEQVHQPRPGLSPGPSNCFALPWRSPWT